MKDCPQIDKIRKQFGKGKIVHYPDSVAMEICWKRPGAKPGSPHEFTCTQQVGDAALEPIYYAIALSGAKKATVELVADMCIPKGEMKRLDLY